MNQIPKLACVCVCVFNEFMTHQRQAIWLIGSDYLGTCNVYQIG